MSRNEWKKEASERGKKIKKHQEEEEEEEVYRPGTPPKHPSGAPKHRCAGVANTCRGRRVEPRWTPGTWIFVNAHAAFHSAEALLPSSPRAPLLARGEGANACASAKHTHGARATGMGWDGMGWRE